MKGSMRTCLLPLAAALLASCERSFAQEPFEDPGPPKVRELPALESPAPETFPELTFHGPPRALDPAAVTEPLYFYDRGRDAYSRLDTAHFDRLQSGGLRV